MRRATTRRAARRASCPRARPGRRATSRRRSPSCARRRCAASTTSSCSRATRASRRSATSRPSARSSPRSRGAGSSARSSAVRRRRRSCASSGSPTPRAASSMRPSRRSSARARPAGRSRSRSRASSRRCARSAMRRSATRRRAAARQAEPMPGREPRGLGAAGAVLLFAGFLGAGLLVYGPALHGDFVSDDFHYVANNAWLHELSLANARAILDPFGPTAIDVVNYAPVQLLIHAGAWQLFGADTLGHHAINVGLHALASTLLALLFLRCGIPRAAAVLGAACFLVHPANVEAVAWISQLKSSASLVLSLCTLLAWPRRPWLGVACFALALLAKATAAAVLPAALCFEWSETGRVRRGRALACAALLAAFAAVELPAHQRSGAAAAELHATPLVLARTIAALGLRYLAIAATSLGVSAFHEPEPARSPLDPWWLASLPVYALLAWRLVVVARRRAPELGFWVLALASFAPVSQLFPFLYPMADRYLYFILPGLLGAGLLAAQEGAARLAARAREPVRALRGLRRAGVVVGALACAVFAARAHERAGIWRSSALLYADAAAHYPDGTVASLLRAKRAALAGDADGALPELSRAVARGYNRFDQLEADAAWDGVRSDPRFRALVRELAARWIESGRRKANPTQTE